MPHQDILITAASTIAGFGAVIFAFRLQRETTIAAENMKKPIEQREPNWVPVSDWLVIVAVVASLTLVVAPLVLTPPPSEKTVRFSSAVCSAAAVLLAGYIPCILAHYDFFCRYRPRPFLTLWEGGLIATTLILAAIMFLTVNIAAHRFIELACLRRKPGPVPDHFVTDLELL